MSNINRHSHKYNERHNANTGFVQDEHRSRTTTTLTGAPATMVSLANLPEEYASKLELGMK
eukprot:2501941-Prorocentrum_lima.AAC.1